MAARKKSAVREIFEDETAGRLDFLHARTLAYSVAGEMDKLEALVNEAREEYKTSRSADVRPRAALHAGVGLWIMRRYQEACEALEPVAQHKDGAHFLGLCRIETADYDGALKSFKAAVSAGADKFVCGMAATEALRRAGKREEALAQIRAFQKSHDGEGELHYQKGRCLEETLDYETAMESYERAVELNPQHAGALFRLGYWNDLRGNDEAAVDYYEKAAAALPVHANVLLNLGILYEDAGNYEAAAHAYNRILAVDPLESRARLYHKDALGSMSMYYDEAIERRQGRTALLLRTPLSEFELSARARSCLEQMDVRTLGDLARLTEADVTRSKNLGETSLAELQGLLESKGLHFGMGAEETPSRVGAGAGDSEQAAVTTKPVGDLDLSVRSLKCMRTLGVQTVGDLTEKTDKELLQSQNFGQTSLAEVKGKLAKLGLALKSR